MDGGEGIIQSDVLDGIQAYRSMPSTRMTVPATNPFGSEEATPRYGRGSVKKYTAIGTARAKPNKVTDYKMLKRQKYFHERYGN